MSAPRRARPDDAAEIVRLRRLMFESMGVDGDTAWIAAAEDHFRRLLEGDDLVGVVVDGPDGGLVASGVIAFEQHIPGPSNPRGSYAYISSMSTDPGWRRRGLARAVLERLLDEARSRGVQRVELHATPDGAPLYRAFGFDVRIGGDPMRLELGDD